MITKPTVEIKAWASSPASPSNVTSPGNTKISAGFVVNERPPSQWMNYAFKSVGLWQAYLDSCIDSTNHITSFGEETTVTSGTNTSVYGRQAGYGSTGAGKTLTGSYSGKNSIGTYYDCSGYESAIDAQGDFLTAKGAYSAKGSGTGVYNTCISPYSGKNSLNNNYGIHIGPYAGSDVTLGDNLIGENVIHLGRYAGCFNSGTGKYSKDYEVWIGFCAGLNLKNTTGTTAGEGGSIGLGPYAGMESKGYYNFYGGYNSGTGANGVGCVYLNRNSGQNRYGSQNIGLGEYALYSSSPLGYATSYSIGLGQNALRGTISNYTTPGNAVNDVIAIGRGAGYSTGSTMNLDGGIFIGKDQGKDYDTGLISYRSRPFMVGASATVSLLTGYMNETDVEKQLLRVFAPVVPANLTTAQLVDIDTNYGNLAIGAIAYDTDTDELKVLKLVGATPTWTVIV